MIPRRSLPLAIAVTTALVALLAGCVPNAPAGSTVTTVLVDSSDDACTLDETTVPSGTVAFEVTNSGERVTEFYLLGSDGVSIIAEVENIAPGSSRTLTVLAQPGEYRALCKPGMIGSGVGDTVLTVTGEPVAQSESGLAAEAITRYTAYVKAQAAELVTGVDTFVEAYVAGDDDRARALFPIARINYERIEPTASQFGDLDPAIDYRKPGAEAEGLEFTGFHRIEMDLWIDAARANYPDETIEPLDAAGRAAVGTRLVDDVAALYDAVHSPDFALSLSDITNGAVGLLDEIAAPDGKLPGEENEFAHTDLYDFLANVEGAEVAYLAVRPLALSAGEEGATLVEDLDREFAVMKDLLATYGSYESGFVFYDTVTDDERAELGSQLNALSEPLARLTHAVLSIAPTS
jgi:iron uptake system component EfeO